jgi:[ribosomal protein S5]-alanine N-acetyltransferase
VEDIRLETERLMLREIEEDDWVSVHRYASDPAVSRFLIWGPNTEEQSRDYVRSIQAYRLEGPRNRVLLGMVCKDSGELIGGIGITRGNGDAGSAEIGYSLHPDYWGRGYATEAARALIEFGFREWRLHRVHARCDPENVGSARVMEKCGMRLEGHFRKLVMVKGEWRDRLTYAILDEEWS